jgi:predicted metalloprotease with PDZ domain
MKKILSAWIALIFLSFSNIYPQAVQNDSYQFYVNLKNVNDNKLAIELVTPKISADKILYRFPAMVPGTYAVYDFGRFISGLKAFDASGKELRTEKKDVNSWEISDASTMYRITYNAAGTFYDTSGVNPVYQMAGTNIEADTDFVVNNHGFFGYFENYVNYPYTLTFTKPAGFYGATSLNAVSRDGEQEVFSAPDYHFLVDNPIMFEIPDTSSIVFDDSRVLVSVFSPSKTISARDIADSLRSLLIGIRHFLGGKLPVDRYTFIFYFSNKPNLTGINGALEHSYSSFYFLTDVAPAMKDRMMNQIISFCAHEFMHIVTPLNLHSEEIGNFDFNKPVMSEHLWLYEGTTEYNAHYIRMKEGLITLDDYLKDVERKMESSKRYNDTLPFTVMSKGVLDKYAKQYQNVYEKGALIGLCLDILMRDETDGNMGLQDVITKLTEKYGKEKSFRDEDLFGDITSITTPKVGEFFNRYVAGPEHLSFKEILNKIGFNFEKTPYKSIRFGASLGFNPETRRLQFTGLDNPTDFAKNLGIKVGDEPVSINGSLISFFNIRDLFGSVNNPIKDGDKFEMVVARTDKSGKEKDVTLKAKVSDTVTEYEDMVTVNSSPTERQLKIRNSWMGK